VVPSRVHVLSGRVCLGFATERGAVWAVIDPIGDTAANVAVYEEKAALAAWRDPSVIERTGDSPEMAAARNRFGTGIIKSILRGVRETMPQVKEWTYKRVTGVGGSERRVRRVEVAV
jgi:hypothetical protein